MTNKTRHIIFYLFAAIIFSSCSFTAGLGDPAQKLNKMRWISGTWENKQDGITFQEIWTKSDEHTYKGLSLMAVDRDTMYTADMAIISKGKKVFYYDTIEGLNHSIPNTLLLVKSSAKKVRFKGSANSPTLKVTYIKSGNDEMTVKSSSIENGRRNDEKFILKKVSASH